MKRSRDARFPFGERHSRVTPSLGRSWNYSLSRCTGISSQIMTKLRDLAIWQARAGCYSQTALSSNDSKTLYTFLYLPFNLLSQVPGFRPAGEQPQPPLPSDQRHLATASPALFPGIHDFTDTEVRSVDPAAASSASRRAPFRAPAASGLLRRVLLPTGQLQRRAPQHPPPESRATCRHRGVSKVTSPPAQRAIVHIYRFNHFWAFYSIRASQLRKIYFTHIKREHTG